jgi:AbrB family looped-hinge helix DNA binding protein
MTTVTVSPKYQVVIPQHIREAMGLKPGMKVQVIQYENRIEYIPREKIKKVRGLLRGIDTRVPRDKDRV